MDSPAGIYLLKANKRNTRTRCEICSKLTIKTLYRTYFTLCFRVSIANFEQVNDGWDVAWLYHAALKVSTRVFSGENLNLFQCNIFAQRAISCSNLNIEILEQGLKYVQS